MNQSIFKSAKFIMACLMPALISSVQATVWTVKPSCSGIANCFTHPQASITVNGRQLSLLNDWSFIQPGDVLRIYPAASASSGWKTRATNVGAPALNIARARGRQGAPILVQAFGASPVYIAQGVNILGSQFVELSGFDISENRSGRPGVAINSGSSDIVLRNNTVRNAPLNGVDINGAGPRITIGPGNVIRNNTGNGVGIRTSGLDPVTGVSGSRLTGNTIQANARHGLELEASHWLIDGNTVQGNGTGVGGTSGLHLFSAMDTAAEDCDRNELRNNYVTGQKDTRFADGNGIQIDHFCDNNRVHHNVVWGNDGAGISIYVAKDNLVYANTLFHNARDTGRKTRQPGAVQGELVLGSTPRVCVNNTDAGACLGWYDVPDQRSSGNQIFNNILHANQNDAASLALTSDILNRHAFRITPNLVFHDLGGEVAHGGETTGAVTARTQAEVNGFFSNSGFDFLLVARPTYVNANGPQKGSEGLRLTASPSKSGEPLGPNEKDMLGRTPGVNEPFWGAYFVLP
jgi:parallel beta-helix repeat protein